MRVGRARRLTFGADILAGVRAAPAGRATDCRTPNRHRPDRPAPPPVAGRGVSRRRRRRRDRHCEATVRRCRARGGSPATAATRACEHHVVPCRLREPVDVPDSVGEAAPVLLIIATRDLDDAHADTGLPSRSSPHLAHSDERNQIDSHACGPPPCASDGSSPPDAYVHAVRGALSGAPPRRSGASFGAAVTQRSWPRG